MTWSMAVLGIPGGRERVQCVQQQGGWGPGGRVLARGVGCGSSSPYVVGSEVQGFRV